MTRIVSLSLGLALVAVSLGKGQTVTHNLRPPTLDAFEVQRTKEDTFKLLKATKPQADIFHKIDDKFGPLLVKLRKEKPAQYTIKRDALNDKYTHEFMGAMTPIQKSAYRKYVRSLRQGYIKAHPDVDADNIFIWGGANIL